MSSDQGAVGPAFGSEKRQPRKSGGPCRTAR
jgi:hypothetical protein